MIVVAGEALLDLVPEPPQVAADSRPTGTLRYRAHPGGSPANTAVAIARLGTPVSLLARLSGDGPGRDIRAHLQRNGVDLRFAVPAAEPTSLAFVDLRSDAAAEYTFYVASTADWQWRSEEMPPRLPEDATALHVGSLAVALPPGGAVLEQLVRRETGRRVVSLDPNVRPALVAGQPGYRDRLAALVALSDLVKVSVEDLAWLRPGEPPEEVAPGWCGDGARLVVVTRGAQGVTGWTAGGSVHRPAEPVRLVDTVGAGDSFMGGLLDWLHRNDRLRPGGLGFLSRAELDEALAFAARVAAVTCSRPGADPPFAAELDAGS